MHTRASNKYRQSQLRKAWLARLFGVVSIFVGAISGLCIAAVALKLVWDIDVIERFELAPTRQAVSHSEPSDAPALETMAVDRAVPATPSKSSSNLAELSEAERASDFRGTDERPALDFASVRHASGKPSETDSLEKEELDIEIDVPLTLHATPSVGLDIENLREPIPAQQQQSEKLATIKGLFEEDYREAKTPTQRAALGKELLNVGITTHDDPVGKYVLLRLSRDIAAQNGDLKCAEEAIHMIASEYEADAADMRLTAYGDLAKSISNPREKKVLLSQSSGLAGELSEVNRFDQSLQTLELAEGLAQDLGNDSAKDQLAMNRELIEASIAAYQTILPDIQKLATDPRDPEANLRVGTYTCLTNGMWQHGLPMLALGSDENLKRLAVLDLGISGSLSVDATQLGKSQEQIDQIIHEIGDGWWEASEKMESEQPKHAIARLKVRSAMWYGQVRDGSTGLRRHLMDKRMNEAMELERATMPHPVNVVLQPETTAKPVAMDRTEPIEFGASRFSSSCETCSGKRTVDCPQCIRGFVNVRRTVVMATNPLNGQPIYGDKSFKSPCSACSGRGTRTCTSCSR